MTPTDPPPPASEALFAPAAPLITDTDAEPVLESLPRDYPQGAIVAPHCHRQVQLLYAVEGVMRVSTPDGVWILPSLRALLVPAGVQHSLVMLSPLRLRTVLIDTALADARLSAPVGETCQLLEVSPLLRELLLALTRLQGEDVHRDTRRVRTTDPALDPDAADATEAAAPTARAIHLSALILDELAAAPTVPLQIPWPTDRRLITVCEAILADPGQQRSLEDWAELAGASPRTLIRLFPQETGLAYRRWVQQVHLAEALSRLARGESVARIAAALGYASPSAFGAMFRRLLGVPPQRYLQTKPGA